MKNVKYLFLLATMLFSINTWSSDDVSKYLEIPSECSSHFQTCKNLFDQYFKDLLDEREKHAKDAFDKQTYIDNKLAILETELRHLKSQPTNSTTQQRRGPTVQATQPSLPLFDFFKSIQLSLSRLFTVFWDALKEIEEPAHEEIGVDYSYSFPEVILTPNPVDQIKINDLKRQRAMYKKLKLTLSAFRDSARFNRSSEGYWEIYNYAGIKSKDELNAYAPLLVWLDVDSIDLTLLVDKFINSDPYTFRASYAEDHKPYSDALAAIKHFQHAFITARPLTKIKFILQNSFDSPGDNYDPQHSYPTFSNTFFNKEFVETLARKGGDTRLKGLKELKINGIYGINEFLENFRLISWHGFIAPKLDTFDIFSVRQESQSLSIQSFDILKEMLRGGLKNLQLGVKVHQQDLYGYSQIFKGLDLLEIVETEDKPLELETLGLSEMGQEDAAILVRYFANKKNNLKTLSFYDLEMVNHGKELLNALTDAYKSGKLKIESLTFTDNNKVQEEDMSKFLTALAESDQAEELETMNFSGSGITDKNIDDFAKAIVSGGHLCPTYKLNLIGNEISVDRIGILAESFKQVCSAKGKKVILSFSDSESFKKDDDAVKALIKKYKPDIEIRVF